MVSSQHFNHIVMASLLDIQSKVVGTCMPLLVLLVQCAPDLLLVQCSHVAHFVHDTALSEYPHVSVLAKHTCFLGLLSYPPCTAVASPYVPIELLIIYLWYQL
ncbi:hypothetical protein EDC04DRAFT_2604786 [Pisolithus marmoratus]|nr:hypothetical protein EDC04DRAFT_2604786 [Pisolithus marmoratus]